MTASLSQRREGAKGMKENDIAKELVDAAYKVHTTLGPGLLETVYEAAMCHELKKRGLSFARQVPVPVDYDGVRLGLGFRADLVIDDAVVLELKSVEAIAPLHKKQLLTYLRIMGKRLGLLINFNDELIRHGIFRIVNGLPDDAS